MAPGRGRKKKEKGEAHEKLLPSADGVGFKGLRNKGEGVRGIYMGGMLLEVVGQVTFLKKWG